MAGIIPLLYKQGLIYHVYKNLFTLSNSVGCVNHFLSVRKLQWAPGKYPASFFRRYLQERSKALDQTLLSTYINLTPLGIKDKSSALVILETYPVVTESRRIALRCVNLKKP